VLVEAVSLKLQTLLEPTAAQADATVNPVATEPQVVVVPPAQIAV
jgi:hypothetical protein